MAQEGKKTRLMSIRLDRMPLDGLVGKFSRATLRMKPNGTGLRRPIELQNPKVKNKDEQNDGDRTNFRVSGLHVQVSSVLFVSLRTH
jgi:hypothetical protein